MRRVRHSASTQTAGGVARVRLHVCARYCLTLQTDELVCSTELKIVCD